jgi:hypothetical protein
MMRAVIKHLLSLCFLLLCGYGQLYAHGYHAVNDFAMPEHASHGVGSLPEFEATNTKFLSSRAEKENLTLDIAEIEVRENEEEESNLSKEYLTYGDYAAAVLIARALGHFSCYSKKISPRYKRFAYTPSCRYLVWQVFRI